MSPLMGSGMWSGSNMPTPGSVTYSTPGTYTFMVPRVQSIKISGSGGGGGGGGGGGSANSNTGSNAGSGTVGTQGGTTSVTN